MDLATYDNIIEWALIALMSDLILILYLICKFTNIFWEMNEMLFNIFGHSVLKF